MRLSIIKYSLCLSLFITISSPSFSAAKTFTSASPHTSRRVNNVRKVIKPLSWARSTRSSYSRQACHPISIPLKVSGGVAPIRIEFNGISLSGTWWKMVRQGNSTYLKHPGGRPHGISFPVKATDANGTVITKTIHVNVTPYVKPVRITSVTYSPSTANQSFWTVAVRADYSVAFNNGFHYSFACGPHGETVSYENMEFIAEYQNGYKYKADLTSIPDINKGNVVKFYAKYTGGQSNKVTVNLPKRTAKYKEDFKHKGMAAMFSANKSGFKGNDTVKLGAYGNLANGQTGCNKEYLTYEKAYISAKSSPLMGVPASSYGAVVYGHPPRGRIINKGNGKIRISWHHMGSGINYTATVEAQRRQGICNDKKR